MFNKIITILLFTFNVYMKKKKIHLNQMRTDYNLNKLLYDDLDINPINQFRHTALQRMIAQTQTHWSVFLTSSFWEKNSISQSTRTNP